jgi:hypothetical protein
MMAMSYAVMVDVPLDRCHFECRMPRTCTQGVYVFNDTPLDKKCHSGIVALFQHPKIFIDDPLLAVTL